MIIRVFRYELHDGQQEAFEATTRGEGVATVLRTPGVAFGYAGRDLADASRGVVLTGWEDFQAVDALVHRELERPAFLSSAMAALIRSGTVTHWEALDLPAVGDGDATTLRLMAGHVDADGDASYFSGLRERVWPQLARVDGLAGAWIGRQVDVGLTEPVLEVSAWRSREAAERGGADDALRGDMHGDAGLVRERVELFELFASVTERDRQQQG